MHLAAERALVSGLAVRRLALTDFRGYESARLAVGAAPVVLSGPNGAGKTNLLEAISFLAPGRGLRRARLGEIDRIGAPLGVAWGVAATLETGSGPVEVGTGRDPAEGSERRLVRIDGKPQRGHAALAAFGAIAWLTPQMDGLFLGPASGRRRFLDRLVYGFDAEHARRLSHYEHALSERSRLLKQGQIDTTWLSALEATLASQGVAVAAARLDLLRRLNEVSAESEGAFPRAHLRVAGTVEAALEATPALEVEERLRSRFAELRRLDAETGGSAEGPQRSDLKVSFGSRNLPAEQASTGEQKALIIAITLANARLIRGHRGQPPLLLLDEVAAHLDDGRRQALYEEILALGSQAWLTGTDEGLFRHLAGAAQFIRVADARLAPLSHGGTQGQ
ncbi:MAG: DNA replication/repair protein RecF [Proteobacteria bacterium]|nr:DNA replication/repair protein RecF [Pseudomonadota bacterium]MBI3498992.1 DNA replication/repair protein RecF [Pseudomonadota bacterium]